MDSSENVIIISFTVFLILLALVMILYMSMKDEEPITEKKVYYIRNKKARPGFKHSHRHRGNHPHFNRHDTPNVNPHAHPHRHRWGMFH